MSRGEYIDASSASACASTMTSASQPTLARMPLQQASEGFQCLQLPRLQSLYVGRVDIGLKLTLARRLRLARLSGQLNA
jgi:hypothetical protein